jgi:hypothetical protein
MRSIAFLFAAVVSVVNVASTYACDDCGCKLDAANGHEHLDDGHAHMDADNVYKSEYSESLAQCAIETYGELGEKRMLLTAKAEEGCNHSRKSLRAEEIKSIKEMLNALGNSESRRLLALGMMIGSNEGGQMSLDPQGVPNSDSIVDDDGRVSDNPEYEAVLSNAEEILEARLEMITALDIQ